MRRVVVIEGVALLTFVASFVVLATAPGGAVIPWAVPVLIAVAVSLGCWGTVPLGTGKGRRALTVFAAVATIWAVLVGGFFAVVLARA